MSQEIMKIALENKSDNTLGPMDTEESGDVQFVYDENQLVLGNSNDYSNITDLVLEDGTRAMIVNGTLVTADGQALILQDNSDLSQYYVDDSTDHIILSKEQENQFLQIISSQNSIAQEQVLHYVQDSDDSVQIQGENEQVYYLQEADQVMPIQEQYQLAEVDSDGNGMPMQLIELDNENIEGMDGAIDLEQFLNQQGMVQVEGGNYQYAILKDGKFHLQTMTEPNTVEMLQEEIDRRTNDEIMLDNSTDLSYEYIDLSKIKGKDMTTGQPITLSKYMNKMHKRNKRKEDSILKYQDNYKSSNISESTSHNLQKLINKKITIGKTDTGKLLVGKILNVTKKTDATNNRFKNNRNGLLKNNSSAVVKKISAPKVNKKTAINSCSKKVTSVDSSSKTTSDSDNSCARTNNPKQPTVISMDSDRQTPGHISTSNKSSQATKNTISPVLPIKPIEPSNNIANRTTAPSYPVPLSTETTYQTETENTVVLYSEKTENSSNGEISPEQAKIVVHKKVVTKDCFDVITRTLTGLMNMESVVKKLRNKTIIIKILEKKYDHDIGDYVKTVSYCTGYMVREYKMNEEADTFSESWKFIPDTNSHDTILCEDSNLATFKERPNGQNNLKRIANLTIQITVNAEGSKTTRVIINPPNMYKCKNCPKSFRTNGALKIHMNEIHPPPSFECTACSIKFNSSEECKEHFLIHQIDDNEGMYECMECNKRFGTSLSLRKHMDIHFKPVTCRYCNQGFSNMRELKKHLPIHESIASQQPPTIKEGLQEIIETREKGVDESRTPSKPLEQKIYCCHICGRQFSRHSNLQRHIEIHQGEGAMYKCAVCNCSYHYVSSLTRHVVTCHVDVANKRDTESKKKIQEVDTSQPEYQFLGEDQIVEMIQMEDMSQENFQYVTETMGNVTGDLSIAEGVEVLEIPVDEGHFVIEDESLR